MLPVNEKLRNQLKWFINGSSLKDDQWVCMSFMGRKSYSDYLPDGYKFASLAIEFPRDVFIEIYKITYDENCKEDAKDPCYELGIYPEWNRVRELNYPSFEELLIKHQHLAERVITSDDVDISELIYMGPKSDPKNGYALKRLDSVSIEEDKVILKGKASYDATKVVP